MDKAETKEWWVMKKRRSSRKSELLSTTVKEKEKKRIGKKDKREEITVSWWNGGGKMMSRIMVNPELNKFLATKPDIFVYGEAQVERVSKKLSLDGYKTIVHKAEKQSRRRGMVLFYKKRYEQIISKQSSSKKYDILWLRMKSSQDESIFGFFYAPGVSHDEKCREEFWDELRNKVDEYKDKKIYLMGYSNSRARAGVLWRSRHTWKREEKQK